MSAHSLPPGRYRQHCDVHSAGSIALLRIPHLLIIGAEPGPSSAITAGQHGREVAGVMSAAQVFNEIDPAELKGTVHILPALNPLALQLRQQDFPLEATRYRKIPLAVSSNLDRLWDGAASLDPILSATTTQVWDAILDRCDRFLDLHCWSRFFCPMAWAHERDQELLQQTGFPFLTLRRDSEDNVGTIRERAWKSKKPIVVAELPGQNTASAEALKLGRRTIRNFLAAGGHLPASRDIPDTQYLLGHDSASQTIDLPAGGLWSPCIQPGELIEKGQSLGEVWDLQTLEPVWTAHADLSGLVLFNGPPIWGEDHREHQVVYPGQRVSKIQEVVQVLRHPARQ